MGWLYGKDENSFGVGAGVMRTLARIRMRMGKLVRERGEKG